MVINRIFICHSIRSRDQQNIQILRYVMEVLQSTGIQVIINKNNGSEDIFFQQLYQELPMCQAVLLLQTPETIYSRRAQIIIRNANNLIEQKKIQVIFRLVCPPWVDTTIPPDWQDLRTFDGTRDYQRACREMVLSLLANSAHSSRRSQTTTTSTLSILPRLSLPQKPPQPNFADSINRRRLLEAEPTAAIPALPDAGLPETPVPINFHRTWTERLKALLEKFIYKSDVTRKR